MSGIRSMKNVASEPKTAISGQRDGRRSSRPRQNSTAAMISMDAQRIDDTTIRASIFSSTAGTAAAASQSVGAAKVGRTVSVDLHAGSWSAGTRFTYAWLANGKVVGHAAKLRLTPKLVGKKVSVRVTGTHGDWTPSTVTSKAVRVKR